MNPQTTDSEFASVRHDLARLETELLDALAELTLVHVSQKWLEEQLVRLQFEISNRLQSEIETKNGKRKLISEEQLPIFATPTLIHMTPVQGPTSHFGLVWERQQIFKLGVFVNQAKDNLHRAQEKHHQIHNQSILLSKQTQGLQAYLMSKKKITLVPLVKLVSCMPPLKRCKAPVKSAKVDPIFPEQSVSMRMEN